MIACCLSGVAPRWRIRERPPHAIWLPASRKPEGCTWVKVSGAGLTDREAQAPEPFWQAENAESPLAGRRTASFVFAWQLRLIPVRRKFVAGIAKLLPPLVPVKRETLQVVSLAMAGLMRGWGGVFHIPDKRERFLFVGLGTDSILGTILRWHSDPALGSARLVS